MGSTGTIKIEDWVVIMIAGFIVGFLICLWILVPLTYERDIQELGQSICEEEFDMGYLSYSTKGGLRCSEKVEVKHYDGIRVNLIEDKTRR